MEARLFGGAARSPPKCRFRALPAVLIFVALVSSPWLRSAAAHPTNLSMSTVRIGPDAVDVELSVNPTDLESALGVTLRAADTRQADAALVSGAASAITAYLTEKATVFTLDGRRCAPAAVPPEVSRRHVTLDVSWACPRVHRGLVYRVTLFQEIAPAARHMVVLEGLEERRFALLNVNAPELPLAEGAASLGQVFVQYLRLGFEHIITGYDHITFVLGVILWGRRLKPLVIVVTAFTVGHSITLSLAALDIASMPPNIVEPLIAASIVYVGIENFFTRNTARRWRLTGLFGLIHGFGFAGALRAFGLPSDAVVPALAAFNLGVEIGQLAVVLTAVPALRLADRLFQNTEKGYVRRPEVVYVCSTVVLALGAYWLVDRTLLG